MLTEQEALARINEKLANKDLKEETQKYIEKLRSLEEILKKHQNNLADLNAKARQLESEIQRTRGAMSILIEMAAEEEGLLEPPAPPETKSE